MEKTYLSESGIPVYTYENIYLHSFCLCVYVKAGSLYEKKEQNGITHFFEHIVLRNINAILGGTLYEKLDRMGLSLNGTTYKEFVQFSISGAAHHFREAVDLLMHLFDPLALGDDEIDTERKRVIAEIRECEKNKEITRILEKTVWKGTSLSRTITGKKKILEGIGKTELCEFRRSFFAPENIFFYLTGNVSEENSKYLYERISHAAPFDSSKVRNNTALVPSKFFKRDGKLEAVPSGRTEVCIAFDINCLPYNDAELNLFYNMLFLGDCCPFYQELSEKTGYIYSYDDQMERYKNIGMLRVCFEVTEEKLEKTLAGAISIFSRMKKNFYTLDYVKAIFMDNSEMELDQVSDFNWDRAYECHILDEDYPDIEAKKDKYRNVTEEKIAEIARDVFRKSNMTVIVKGKRSEKKNRKLQKIIDQLDQCGE